jgi:antitoxin component of MazEF toxin-antitoxin module
MIRTFTTSVVKGQDVFLVKIPENIMQAANFRLEDLITCTVEDGTIVLTPKRRRYTLEELLEGTTEPAEEVDWGLPEGAEVW